MNIFLPKHMAEQFRNQGSILIPIASSCGKSRYYCDFEDDGKRYELFVDVGGKDDTTVYTLNGKQISARLFHFLKMFYDINDDFIHKKRFLDDLNEIKNYVSR